MLLHRLKSLNFMMDLIILNSDFYPIFLISLNYQVCLDASFEARNHIDRYPISHFILF